MEKVVTKSFTDLLVWQKSHELVLLTYKFTKLFPKEELFALTSQFRRAVVSVPANIAEGYKRMGKNDKLRFYNISQGSLEECRYYLILSKDLNYINEEIFNAATELLDTVSRLLNSYCEGLIKKY